MKILNLFTKIVMKTLEVAHWIAVVVMAVIAIGSAASPQWLEYFGKTPFEQGKELSVYGFEITVSDPSVGVDLKTICLFAIGAILIFALMAMVFRNLYLIVKNSEGSTPFQKDNTRMVKEIGIFAIAIPIVGLIMSSLLRSFSGVETSVRVEWFIIGIAMLCLTQFFNHGTELEKDVDGLL